MSEWKCCKRAVPQRYIICTILSMCILFLYGSRHALSAILPHIIYVRLIKYNHTPGEICPDAMNYLEPIYNVHQTYLEWTQGQKYFILSSFYIGYILFHLPSGIISDLYGARHTLSLSMLISGLVVGATPTILTETKWYCSALAQILLGALQGMCMAAVLSLIQHWAPFHQQTFLTAYTFSGTCLGSTFISLMSSFFIIKNRWNFIFYIWSGLIAVCYLCCLIFVYSHPKSHPHISHSEKIMLEDQIGTDMPIKIPWKKIMTDSAVWALVVAQIGYQYLSFTVDTHMPEFFMRVIGFDLSANFYAFTIPYICQWIATLGAGYLGDYLIGMNYVPVVYMRGIFAVIGNVVAGLFLLLATYMQCNKVLVLACFTCSMMAKGCIFSAIKSNVLDITRHYSGVLQGVHNGLPAFTGIASSQIISYICGRHTMKEWRKVFWLAFALSCFTTTFYAICARGERASYDFLTEENIRKPRKGKY